MTKNDGGPNNADRAMWGSTAMTSFARAVGQDLDLQVDPETVLCDLLTDLMHWCDLQKTLDHLAEPVDFESALGRARRHHGAEHLDDRD